MERRLAVLAVASLSLAGCSKEEDQKVPPEVLAGTWVGITPHRTLTFAAGEFTSDWEHEKGVYDAQYFREPSEVLGPDRLRTVQTVRMEAVRRSDGYRLKVNLTLKAGGMALQDPQGDLIRKAPLAGG